jgi:hypothetical protein
MQRSALAVKVAPGSVGGDARPQSLPPRPDQVVSGRAPSLRAATSATPCWRNRVSARPQALRRRNQSPSSAYCWYFGSFSRRVSRRTIIGSSSRQMPRISFDFMNTWNAFVAWLLK